MLYGRIVIIEIDPTEFNHHLKFAIMPNIINNEMESGDKWIPIHANFRMYLYSTSYMNKKCSMQLLANIQTINFKMTTEQLEQRVMDTVILIEMPLVKNKIE